MIKVTLEFPSVEAAIATLGKIMVGTPAAAAHKAPALAGESVTLPAVPTTPRKPRADAGKKRGPHNAAPAIPPTGDAPKGDAESASPPGAAPQTAAPETAPAEGDKPQPSGAVPGPAAVAPTDRNRAASVPSEADAQAALEKVFAGKGLQAAQSVLAAFGVSRLRDVKPEDRAEFIKKAEGVAK